MAKDKLNLNDPNRKYRIAQYARVSREEQKLENQLIVLEDEVKRHPNWEVVQTYTDKSSGANKSRPGLDLMLADAKDKKFDIIICTKLDRLARSVLNLANICKDLDDWGIGIKFVEQNFDLTTAEGTLIRNILSATAEFELELIHSRTVDGQERARREGKIIGRPKSKLSDYQINKAKEILAENPNISQRKLAEQFIGIDRKQLIRELKALGILKDSSTGTV